MTNFPMLSRRQLVAASPLLLAPQFVPSLLSAVEPKGSNSGDFDFQETTTASKRAVEKGVRFLLKAINRNGACGVDIGQTPDIGCTSMVGLALQSMGNTPLEGRQSNELVKLRNFIIKQTKTMPSEDITKETSTQLQSKIGRHAHSFFATLFLSQVLGQGGPSKATEEALHKVVNAVVKSQLDNGSWGGRSWAPTLGTVMGWVSLRASDFVGVKVGAAPEKTAEHLIKTMRSSGGNRGWMHELYKNATGIRVLYAMQKEKDASAVKAFKHVLDLVNKNNSPSFKQAGGEEFLAFHLITETMLQKGGKEWKSWYPVVRNKIIDVQNKDGSWTGHHCITSRVFCTAASILVLTSPNRFLPISQL